MSRTFAMRVYAASYAVLALSFAYILGFALLPAAATEPSLGAIIPILAGFLVVFIACAALAAFWRSAPSRPRFWIVALVPAVLFLLMNAPYLPSAVSHPADSSFPGTIVLVTWSVILLIAGIRAYRDARARTLATAGGSPRAVWAVGIVAGLTLGAAVTGYVGAHQGGGATLSDAPTATATLVAQGTKYLTTSYETSASGVLGLFVENRDAAGHSFDIDSLNIHVTVPANATIAVAIKPTGAGTLAFYCSIPGHREAGMAGTITVK
jgi:hypothetical protein